MWRPKLDAAWIFEWRFVTALPVPVAEHTPSHLGWLVLPFPLAVMRVLGDSYVLISDANQVALNLPGILLCKIVAVPVLRLKHATPSSVLVARAQVTTILSAALLGVAASLLEGGPKSGHCVCDILSLLELIGLLDRAETIVVGKRICLLWPVSRCVDPGRLWGVRLNPSSAIGWTVAGATTELIGHRKTIIKLRISCGYG